MALSNNSGARKKQLAALAAGRDSFKMGDPRTKMGGRKGKYSTWKADVEAVQSGRMLRQDFISKVLGKLDGKGETYFDKMVDLVARAIGSEKSTISERERARLCIDFFKNFTPKMVDMYVETPQAQDEGFKVVLGAEISEEKDVIFDTQAQDADNEAN